MYKTRSRYLQYRSLRGAENDKPSPRRQGVPKKLRSAFEKKQLVPGEVLHSVNKGFTIRVFGFETFCPFHELFLGSGSKAELAQLRGTRLWFAVLDVSLTSAVVSRRSALKVMALERVRASLGCKLALWGTVKSVEPYGALIYLDGIVGLVHISEVSDEWIDDLTAVLNRGQKVKVVVLAIDTRTGRISLSMRQAKSLPVAEKSSSNYKGQAKGIKPGKTKKSKPGSREAGLLRCPKCRCEVSEGRLGVHLQDIHGFKSAEDFKSAAAKARQERLSKVLICRVGGKRVYATASNDDSKASTTPDKRGE